MEKTIVNEYVPSAEETEALSTDKGLPPLLESHIDIDRKVIGGLLDIASAECGQGVS